MEIRVLLDRVEPPAGRLGLVYDSERASRAQGVDFTGWLGLLRALYEVVGPLTMTAAAAPIRRLPQAAWPGGGDRPP
jgi:hypothetical protein